ncbi:MAG TPA: serine hydrolase domain-containing protein [Thermoanaerobaculia bacterium]|nr:serine hydrolase domain-containing protein [Thermoanaerobaculia bacterium]
MTIAEYLEHEIALGSFPGASWVVGSRRGIDQTGAVGHSVAVPLRIPATVDTIYDCASITKPLVTTTLALELFPLDHVIHGYTVFELLTHTTGLRPWLPLYTFDDPVRAILEEGPECERGTRVIYSDLNFILLWMAIGRDFDELARSRVGARIKPAASLKPRIAATEWGQWWEMKMAMSMERGGGSGEKKLLPAPRSPLRAGLIWGETHDGNSHALGHGCAGNAGLFATATEVFEITRSVLARTPPVKNETAGLNDARGLGWQMGTGSAMTEMLSPGNFGHTGFTGTSVWIDPQRDKIMVLLTNRVHPIAAPNAMLRIRGEFHRLALAE